MAKQWDVNTEQVKNSANKIGDLTEKYKTAYEKLYSELGSLRSAKWKGTASDKFNSQLESYRASFEQLKSILDSYKEFLNTAAQSYESTESTIESEAANLNTGN